VDWLTWKENRSSEINPALTALNQSYFRLVEMVKHLFLSTLVLTVSGIALLVGWVFFFGPEQYYSPDPFCDTQMAKGYSPERFLRIKPGMTVQQVEQLVGKPLFTDTSELPKSVITYRYTDDGKLLGQQVPWYKCNDYAWYSSSVVFDTAMVVQRSSSGWIYD
jgi:hypothetical protein